MFEGQDGTLERSEAALIPDAKFVGERLRRSSLEDVAAKSVKRRLGSLNSFLTYLLSMQVLSDPSPFAGQTICKIGESKSIVSRGFSTAECLELIKAASAGKDRALSDLIQLALYTAARIEELCTIWVEDAVVEDNHNALRISQAKTQAGVRFVPLHPAIASVVDRLIEESIEGFLLPSGAKNQ